MADEKKPESSGLPSAVPVTVVLTILAGLVYTHLSPYQDERPSTHPLKEQYEAAQDVNARLWQDPFAALDDASEDAPTEKLVIRVNQDRKILELEARPSAKSQSHKPNQIYKGNKPVAGDDITVIAVTLPGDSYQEAAENRMRWRYAVLSALANQNATPRDEQHIGYFHPKSNIGLQKRVAFEWWFREKDNKKVLLLWVDESSLLGCPATKLKNLLIHTIPPNAQEQKIAFHYKVIGPNTSTLLRDMLKEVDSIKKGANVPECLEMQALSSLGKIGQDPIIYFSAGATASDFRLLTDVLGYSEAGETVSGYLHEQEISLYRTTATDLEMMKIVAKELLLRQVEKTDQVVILSEWDTYYGRTMPKAFECAWNPSDNSALKCPNDWKSDDNDQAKNKKVITYGYMRGLDGKLPDKGDKSASLAEKKPDSKDLEKSNTEALIEPPEGQNQKDYLRRLANYIYETDQDLKDQGDKKGVAAIGVLGSDVHDKIMILEALRQHFPHKLFFTTDLGAAYNHPAKWRQTHNLLVASAFDLKLRPELQGNIPPFRDTYQTAFFLATQLALKGRTDIDPILPCIYEQALLPQMFVSIDIDAAYKSKDKWCQTHILLEALAYDPIRDNNFKTAALLVAQMTIKDGKVILNQEIDPPRLFEIGRIRPIPLPTSVDTISKKPRDDSNKPASWSGLIAKLHGNSNPASENSGSQSPVNDDKNCSKANIPECKTVQPQIFVTSQLNWSFMRILVLGLVIFIPPFVNWRVRKSSWYRNCVALVLLLVFLLIPWWNAYMFRNDAEPFYWYEGVSIWPSQLLRLSVVLSACFFFWRGHLRIKKMQKELQVQVGNGNIRQTFALPNGLPDALSKERPKLRYWDVLFIGNWKINEENTQPVSPDKLWEKYLVYFGSDMKGGFFHLLWVFLAITAAYIIYKLPDLVNVKDVNFYIIIFTVILTIFLFRWLFNNRFPGWLWRLIIHGLVFFLSAVFIISQTEPPNVPARGVFAHSVNSCLIILAVISTIFLITWVVENTRLCQRLVVDLSENKSLWNPKAKNWAIEEMKVAPECVEDWLDIQLVARLTKTMQGLIYGPVICIALLLLARSPAIDDWNIPWGLEMVYITMLLYAISAELFLQNGAKIARKKAIDQLSEKISKLRNRNSPNPHSEIVIKRIEAEIERIKDLREGAFSPWYEWPLVRSFGGLSSLWVALQYLAGVWESGSL